MKRIKKTYDIDQRSAEIVLPAKGKGKPTTIKIGLPQLSPEMIDNAALYGIVNKITSSKDPVKIANMIAGGVWPARSDSSGKVRYPVTVTALAQIRSVSESEMMKIWTSWPNENKRKAQADPAVKAKVAEIRGDSHLSELFDETS